MRRRSLIGQERPVATVGFQVPYLPCEIPLESTTFWLHCALHGWSHLTFVLVS